MTVREDREVAAPPAMTLAALATAGENLGHRVRDVRTKPGILLMTAPMRIRGASSGFIVTARARRFNQGTRLGIDVTPLVGSWARRSADQVLSDLTREFQRVMQPPHARIRKPKRTNPGAPFGGAPRWWSLLWAAVSLVVFGLMLGGFFWVPAAAGVLGSVLLWFPQDTRWWNRTVTVLALLTLPGGLVGMAARRMARANLLWRRSVTPHQR
ncbi:MAG: hypothetical protein R3185_03470 [Candidatus Thermoplasmatota archaeon]|nr:hypothetical protein [Candidatus Thermoplasmatota archaeon]